MTEPTTTPASRKLIVALPLVLFVALAAVFFMRLGAGDPSKLPSAMLGKVVPEFVLPPVEGLLGPDGKPAAGLSSADLKGRVTVVNVWASWCVPCRTEHPQLVELAKDTRIRLVSINYKDQPENARRFLGALGNPYAAVGADPNGRAAIDWGVYGVPETFIVGKDGHIAYKHVGPIYPENLKGKFGDEINQALARP